MPAMPGQQDPADRLHVEPGDLGVDREGEDRPQRDQEDASPIPT